MAYLLQNKDEVNKLSYFVNGPEAQTVNLKRPDGQVEVLKKIKILEKK